MFLPESTAKRISLANKFLKIKESKTSSIEKAIIEKTNDGFLDFRYKDIVLKFKDIENIAAYRIIPIPEDLV